MLSYLEADKAVLGEILTANKLLDAKDLKPDDFYAIEHGIIFQKLLELEKQNELIDIITLSAALKSAGTLNDIGGPAYLAELCIYAIHESLLPAHVELIQKEAASRRERGEAQQHIQKLNSSINFKKSSAFKYTGFWNAERLVEAHGENFHWCQELKSWFIWDGKIWRKDPGGLRMESLAKKLIKEMIKSDDKDLRKHAVSCQERKKLADMVDLAQSEENVSIETTAFDKDDFLLNCANGIVDLKTGKLFPHARSKYMTGKINVDFLLDAKCPTWEWFLNDIFDKNQNIITFLKKAIGYSLTGCVSEQCFFILYGNGRNGKNTFIETITTLLGEHYCCKTGVDNLTAKNKNGGANEDIAGLWGKRFTWASESESSKKLNEGLIKELTGDGVIKARFLYGHAFEFYSKFKIFLITNHKPKIRGTDEGIWSRVKLIPFTKFIPPEERIPDLGARLKQELPGILRWAIEGCLQWQKEGLGTTPEIQEATEGYRKEEDFLGNFLKEVCNQQEHCQTSSSVLYERFKSYALENGDYYISQKDFTRDLESRGLKKKQQTFGVEKGRMFWQGIGIINENSASTGVFASTVGQGSFPSLEEEQ